MGCETCAHPPPQAPDRLPRWPSSWWAVARQKPNWQMPSSLCFLVAQPLHYLLAPSLTLCESSGSYSPQSDTRKCSTPLLLQPLENYRTAALPQALKTPAWMMPPTTMRFHAWIGGTGGVQGNTHVTAYCGDVLLVNILWPFLTTQTNKKSGNHVKRNTSTSLSLFVVWTF